MSILFATPMYGGQCTSEYFLSCMELQRSLVENGVEHEFLITTNESLIPRARNTAVARFMNDDELKDYEAFMFIDADIEFKAEDVAKLWNLMVEGDHEVVTAAYPMKREGSDVTAWKDGELVKLDELKEPTKVDYAGTGFLLIRRSAFEKLQNEKTYLFHTEGNVGKVYDHFRCRVSKGNDVEDRFYLSEDYAFCNSCNAAGIDIILDPSIRLGHVGRYTYQ